MSTEKSSNPLTELEWINLKKEIRGEIPQPQKVDFKLKFIEKFKENAIVPLGCLTTIGILSYGFYNFIRGRTRMSQKMMRYRVAAQGLTVVAICFSVISSGGRKKKDAT